jgi:DNA replication protein DnaC
MPCLDDPTKLLPTNRPITNIWSKDFIWCDGDVKKNIRAFWERIPKVNSGLLIHGIAGTGKTTIAVNIAREWKRKVPGAHIGGYDFFDILNAMKTFPERRDIKENAILWNLQNNTFPNGLLIIDDFGAGRITEAAADSIETLIRNWEKKGTNIIFTTNISPDKIMEIFNEQLWSRICGMTVQIEITGRDWRVK